MQVGRAIKEESKVANRDWVDYQACSLLQYINVIANLFIIFLNPTRKHLQLSTYNKKLICCYKTLHLVMQDQRNQVIGVLKAGSTVNHFAALDRLFIILRTGATDLGLSEFVHDLVAHV